MPTSPRNSEQVADAGPLDVAAIRQDFPIFSPASAQSPPLVYLDSAASSQRPRQVIEAISRVYETAYSNVHRSGHGLSSLTTSLYEASREAVRRFINAAHAREIIFTSGTTAAINLVARSWGDANLHPGDEILLTLMEHHSNIVPWQQLAARTGSRIVWTPITDDFQLDLEAFGKLLTERTKIVAVTAVSNVLGTVNPIGSLIQQAHAIGARVLVDAAQAIPHETLDVQAWDADFVAFSGHKMLGPSGVGVLYGKEAILAAMPPFLGGGSMIRTVTLDGFTSADLPAKFEAGTPPIAPAIGLKPAIEYLQQLGMPRIAAHERRLAAYARERLQAVGGVCFLGSALHESAGIVSFTLEGIHSKDVAITLDLKGVAIREGHHCAMPLHQRYGVDASCRASFYLYNTLEEVDRLAAALQDVKRLFKRK